MIVKTSHGKIRKRKLQDTIYKKKKNIICHDLYLYNVHVDTMTISITMSTMRCMRYIGSVLGSRNNLAIKELRIELANKVNNEHDNDNNCDNNGNDDYWHSHSRSHVRDDSLTGLFSNELPAELEEDDNNGFSVRQHGDSLHLARIVQDSDCGLIDYAFGTSDLLRQDALHSLEDLGVDISNMQELNNYIDNESFNILFGNVNNYDSEYGYGYDSGLKKYLPSRKSNNTKITISRAVSLVRIITIGHIQISINVATHLRCRKQTTFFWMMVIMMVFTCQQIQFLLFFFFVCLFEYHIYLCCNYN